VSPSFSARGGGFQHSETSVGAVHSRQEMDFCGRLDGLPLMNLVQRGENT
jgi:hypothetical protein